MVAPGVLAPGAAVAWRSGESSCDFFWHFLKDEEPTLLVDIAGRPGQGDMRAPPYLSYEWPAQPEAWPL